MDEPSGRTGLGIKPLPVRRGEWPATLLSGAFFFCVLFGMSMLRPVREAMGVERGMDSMQNLFTWTAIVSLVVALLFAGLVSRTDRRRFIPIGFRVVMLCLGGFMVARGLMGDDVKRHAGGVFYVWLSVFNMFVTSVFWAYMADIWKLEQAKRLYPVIGVGGTLGAFAGASVPWQLGERLGEHAPIWLMLFAIVVFEIGVRCMLALDKRLDHDARQKRQPHAMGGSMLEGLAMVARSPYMLGIALNAAFVAISATLIYFAGVKLVADKSEEMAGRIALFAELDLAKQLATLLLQLFVTGHLIRWLGVAGTLCVLPLLTLAGFAAVALVGQGSDAQIWVVFAIFQGLHSAVRYGVMRPARETLFSVVSESEKYKAKSVVDTFVYRAGDVAGARIESALTASAGVTVGSMVMLTAPMAGVWVILALSLGAMQRRRASAGTPSSLERANKGADA